MSRSGEEATVNAMEVVEMDSVLSKEEILKAQKEDKTVQAIIKLLEKNSTDVQVIGTLKGLADKKEELFIDEGVLYRQLKDEHCQVVLPPALHGRFLAMLHDDSASGHLGIDKTESRFLEAFYWPNIKKDHSMVYQTV